MVPGDIFIWFSCKFNRNAKIFECGDIHKLEEAPFIAESLFILSERSRRLLPLNRSSWPGSTTSRFWSIGLKSTITKGPIVPGISRLILKSRWSLGSPQRMVPGDIFIWFSYKINRCARLSESGDIHKLEEAPFIAESRSLANWKSNPCFWIIFRNMLEFWWMFLWLRKKSF